MELPRSGDVLKVTGAASCQFGPRPIIFRVIRVHPWRTYEGWVWLDGYELDAAGDAIERRTIFVIRAGLLLIGDTRTPQARSEQPSRKHGNQAPARVARQTAARTSAASRT